MRPEVFGVAGTSASSNAAPKMWLVTGYAATLIRLWRLAALEPATGNMRITETDLIVIAASIALVRFGSAARRRRENGVPL